MALGVQESVGLLCASGVYDTAVGLDDHSCGCVSCLLHVAVVEALIMSFQRSLSSAKACSKSRLHLYVQGRDTPQHALESGFFFTRPAHIVAARSHQLLGRRGVEAPPSQRQHAHVAPSSASRRKAHACAIVACPSTVF